VEEKQFLIRQEMIQIQDTDFKNTRVFLKVAFQNTRVFLKPAQKTFSKQVLSNIRYKHIKIDSKHV
jgi:hypothetical protein